ncbi:hypothetical protein [Gramella sp. KN1008]|uniref:hypothetical protein n=1 Tax=Gramella sp. KN1008 TaxID=2529298 RepID=UPI00103E39CE|nr:hypothetical protein [Gramella sp. KN1008]TBW30120.1 hypothetical protein EZJ28_01590 [Gramella sp. KN1008]
MMVLVTILTGLLAMKITDYFSKPKQSGFVSIQFDLKNKKIFFYSTLLIAFFNLYLILTGKIGYGSDSSILYGTFSFIFQGFQLITPFFLIVLAFIKFSPVRYPGKYNYLFYFFFIVQISTGLISGMKESVLVPIILISVPYLTYNHKIPKKIIVLGFLSLLILYPVNTVYRNILNNKDISRISAFRLATTEVLSDDFVDNLISGGQSYSSRFSLFPWVMYSVQEEKNWTEYKNLDRYLILPLAWIIPRTLLPDKPTSNTGAILYKKITGSESNSVTPSTYGWAYFEGGLIPVFISFLLFGLLISIIESKINMDSLLGLIIFTTLITGLIKVEADIYFRIAGIFQLLITIFFLYKVFIRKPKTEILYP